MAELGLTPLLKKKVPFDAPNAKGVIPPLSPTKPSPATVLPVGQQSDLFKGAQLRSEFAPLLKHSDAWTKCAPYKEQRFHRSPSDSIGNCYSPATADLKLSAKKTKKLP